MQSTVLPTIIVLDGQLQITGIQVIKLGHRELWWLGQRQSKIFCSFIHIVISDLEWNGSSTGTRWNGDG